jgi:hypothetical protein
MNIWRTATFCSGVALFLLTSCSTAPLKAIRTPPPEGTDGEGWNKMHLRAASDLNCPIESLTTKTLSDQSEEYVRKQSFEISGCGTSVMFFMHKVKYGTWSFVSADDFRACMRIALQDMPIADEPFRQGVETLNYRRHEALAEQRKLVGHPIVLVIAGVTIIVSEVALEAGAITVLFAVTVKVVDKAKDDVVELINRPPIADEEDNNECTNGYVRCTGIEAGMRRGSGNNWGISRCGSCLEVCKHEKSWPSSIPVGDKLVPCF